MDKYQEALDEIFMQVNKAYIDACYAKATKQSMRKVEDIVGVNIKILQELVDEKLEQDSRKDYLKVGSEWECVIRCNGMSFIHIEGTIVKISNMNGDSEVLTTPITELENYLDPFGEYVDIDEVFVTDQFLLCFKPLKEGE